MVLYVASSYSGAWRILHMDDFYNSIKISHDLYKLKIHNNGTLRSSRDVPHKPMQILPAKHDTIEKKLDDIVNFFIFHDSKIVKFINTASNNNGVIINKKCNVWIKDKITGIKQRSEVIKRILEAIMSYNANMNKVDKYNQSISYINLLRRAKR